MAEAEIADPGVGFGQGRGTRGKEVTMTTLHHDPVATRSDGKPGLRVVTITGREELDPSEPWETPATESDIKELSTRRFERLPHRPMNIREVPAGALDALRAVVGEVGLHQLFVIPRVARVAGTDQAGWVLSPTEVLAVGAERLAVWLNDPAGPRIRADLPLGEVVAMLDRTVLLHGRLELITRDSSVVIRYNTVGRPEIRALLQPVRAASAPATTALPSGTGRDPASLPHKWMALIHSTEVGQQDEPMVVAAGDLDDRSPHLHDGVAALTARELVVATDPTPDVHMAQYGFDLAVVPRSRLMGIDGHASTLVISVDAAPGRVELRIAAHASLVAEAVKLLKPLAATNRS
jgi:hypothetical protein